jgi:DNA-binding NtrC family response regulator
LERAVASGSFREDLFYRLAEFRIHIPSLRERPEDIATLARRFLEEAGMELRRPARAIEPEALALLQAQRWPGNVRELRNVVRQATLLCTEPSLRPADLERVLKNPDAPKPGPETPATERLTAHASLTQIGREGLARAETQAIRECLRASGGNILRAARMMQVDNKTLHVKLKKYGIRAKDFDVPSKGRP